MTALVLTAMAGVAAAAPSGERSSQSPIATQGAPKLPVKPHPTNVRYAYSIAGGTVQLNRDCGPGRALLYVQVIVRNTSAYRFATAVRVKVLVHIGPTTSGSAAVAPVPPKSSRQVRVALAYPHDPKPGKASLRVMLVSTGQAWGDLQLETFVPPALCKGMAPAQSQPMRGDQR